MCHIGNTFSHTLGRLVPRRRFLQFICGSAVVVSLFLIVVLVMMIRFGVLFNLIFVVIPMSSLTTLGLSMFSLFRGLLGDVSCCHAPCVRC